MPNQTRKPKCRHCGKAIVTCVSRPLPHACPPPGHGWVHYFSHAHRCQPQAPTTYAQPPQRAAVPAGADP